MARAIVNLHNAEAQMAMEVINKDRYQAGVTRATSPMRAYQGCKPLVTAMQANNNVRSVLRELHRREILIPTLEDIGILTK